MHNTPIEDKKTSGHMYRLIKPATHVSLYVFSSLQDSHLQCDGDVVLPVRVVVQQVG